MSDNILGFPHGTRPGDYLPCDTELAVEVEFEEPAHVNPLPREEILDEAKRLICGDRHQQHGDAKQNLGLTAILWSAWTSHDVFAHDVAMMNALQKISRMVCGHTNKDNFVDVLGYVSLAWELLPEK